MLDDICMDRFIEETQLVSIFVIKSQRIIHFQEIVFLFFEVVTTLSKYSER